MTLLEVSIGRLPPRSVANAVVHSGFVISGVVTTLLGPLLPILAARWSMSDERAGLFFTMQFCACLLGIGSLNALIPWRGYRLTFFLGFVSIALGIAALNIGNELLGLTATATFGYGLGLILSSTNLWVAEIAGSRRAAAVSILNLAWGIGAISCPALVLLAQRSHRLAILLYGIAGCSIFVALTLAAMNIEPRVRISADPPDASGEPSARLRTAWALGGLFFLYVGTETSVGGWTAAFAKRMGTTPAGNWELAPMFFWAGLLMGRALTAVILSRVSERALLKAGLIVAGICNGALLLTTTFGGAAAYAAGDGLGLACVYPLLVAWMVEHYGNGAKRTASIMFALATLGGATLPWLVGFTSTHADSLRAGLMVPFLACITMLALAARLRGQPPTRAPEIIVSQGN